MNYSIEYKYEKMLKAMYALAANSRSIRDRIDESYHCFWLLKEDEFKGEGRQIRKKIQSLITKNKAKEGYIIPHNILHMPLARAEEIASLIFELYNIVATDYLKGHL